VRDKDVLRQTLLVWLSYWRDVLLKTSGAQAALTNADRAEEIESLAGRLDLSLARRVTAALENAIERLEKNVNPRLLAEVTLMDWPKISG
jgi:DNA polymerase-3 subunit delta'